MAFDPSTAQPETAGFDPSTAAPEDAPAASAPGNFDPASAQPEDEPGLLSRIRTSAPVEALLGKTDDEVKAGNYVMTGGTETGIPGVRSGAKYYQALKPGDPGFGQSFYREVPESEIYGHIAPYIKGVAGALKQTEDASPLPDIDHAGKTDGVMGALAGAGDAVYNTARELTKVPNLVMGGTAADLTQAAQGAGPAAIAARQALAKMGIAFGGMQAAQTPGQVRNAQAVTSDPNSSLSQKVAAWASPVLGTIAAAAGAHGALELDPQFAQYVANKPPAAAIDSLNQAIKDAATDPDRAAATKARNDYVTWWQKTLNADDNLRQSQAGADALKTQLAGQADLTPRQMRDRGLLQRKMAAVLDTIKGNQLGGPEQRPAVIEEQQEQGANVPAPNDSAQPETAALAQHASNLNPEQMADAAAAPEADQATRARDVTQPATDVPNPGTPTPDVTEGVGAQGREPTPAPPPEVTPSAFQAGQQVRYLLASGQEGTGTVAEGSGYGRIKITTPEGNTLRVPAEQVRAAATESATPNGPPDTAVPKTTGFDASTATPEPEIEAQVDFGDEPAEPNSESRYAAGPAVQDPEALDAPVPQAVPDEPTPAGASKIKRSFKIGNLPDGSLDLLNVIDQLGGVRGPSKDAGGEYDGWSAAFGKGPARLLRNSKGQAIDQLVGELQEHGYKFQSPDELYRAVDQAIQTRVKMRAAMKQSEMFGGDQPFNLSSEKQKAPEDPFGVDEIVSQAKQQGQLDFEGGFVDPRLLGAVAGGGSGALYGFSQGATPEERIRNAVKYGAAGLVAGLVLGQTTKTLGESNTASTGFAAMRNQLTGKELPNMRAASSEAANAAYRLVGSRVFGGLNGRALAAEVLGPKWNDPAFANRVGAVLVQEMQEAKLKQLYDQRDAANVGLKDKDPAVRQKARETLKAVEAQIPNVRPVFDMPQNGGIDSPEAFEAALKDPEVMGAIARHKELVQADAEASHVALNGKLAPAGPNTGAFINTQAIDPEDPDFDGGLSEAGILRGNLKNPRLNNTVFSQARSGTAAQYDIDYNNQVARMASGNAQRAAKLDYYKTLQDQDLAATTQPGQRGPQGFREETGYKNPNDPQERMWIRQDIFGEHRKLMDTDTPLSNHFVATGAKALNLVQLKGIFDPTFHAANIASAIASAPGGFFRRMPGVNMADALVRIGSRLRDVAADDPTVLSSLRKIPGVENLLAGDSSRVPQTRSDLAQIAQIGAMREGHPGVMQALDRAGRLAMNDLFDQLAQNHPEIDTEGNRRDFINQIGQYNTRTMGRMKSVMKELGVSPFIVAGQGFNRLGVRSILGTPGPGFEGANPGTIAGTMAKNIGALAATVAVSAGANYLLNGNLRGPTGTQLGAVGWKDQDGTLHQVDPLKWTNARRGARILGVNALANGLADGRDLNHAGGQALTDITNGIAEPWAGPAVNALSIYLTGHSVAGYREADQANPQDHTNAPTLQQDRNNAVAALANLNPVGRAALEGTRNPANPQRPDNSVMAALKSNAAALGGAVGYRSTPNPPSPNHGQLESALYADEQGRDQRVKSVQDLMTRLPSMSDEDKIKAVAALDPLQQADLLQKLKQTGRGRDNQDDPLEQDMSVQGKVRYIADRLAGFKSQSEIADFIQSQDQKKFLTPEVATELSAELGRRQFHAPAQ